jgi:hypothetical protein
VNWNGVPQYRAQWLVLRTWWAINPRDYKRRKFLDYFSMNTQYHGVSRSDMHQSMCY